jgi:hypothetical protein
MIFERPRAEGTRVFMKASWVPILTYAYLQTARMVPQGTFHGEVLPDLALVQIGVKGLPPVQLASGGGTIRIGMPVAFAGFPLGSTALHLQFDEGARPILAQITPFVRHGVVSSVHPFPCDLPHGFTIDAASHGGASGSPIFHVDDPRVIGMLYGAFEGEQRVTYGIPMALFAASLQHLLSASTFILDEVPTIEELERGVTEGKLPSPPPLFSVD